MEQLTSNGKDGKDHDKAMDSHIGADEIHQNQEIDGTGGLKLRTSFVDNL